MTDPADPVETQLQAFNQHDLEAFVACFTEDICACSLTDGPYLIGREQLREAYRDLFARNPDIQAIPLYRAVVGQFVTDHERIVGRNGAPDRDSVVAYRLRGALIDRFWFVR